MKSIFNYIANKIQPVPVGTYVAGKVNILMFVNRKKNQGYFRDLELANQTNAVMIYDDFNYEKYDWDALKIISAIYGDTFPDCIYVHYNRNHTYKIKNISKIGIPVIGFVGDPQDFLSQDDRMILKRQWFEESGAAAYLTIAPQANWMVRDGLRNSTLPIINSHLAVDVNIFKDNNKKRVYDIGSFGAHTDKKYPFRILVRNYLLSQNELTFNKRQRVGRGGNDAKKFANELNRYKSCFTCASIYGYPVAKYFEIPACGTLLFAEDTSFLDKFGYVDGENFVKVSPENFSEKINYYLREMHPSDRENIASRGRELVLSRHTWQHRIPAIIEGLQVVLNGKIVAPDIDFN